MNGKADRKSIVLLDAPSNLGLRPPRQGHEPGVWRLPQALRAHGLPDRVQAQDAGTVARLSYSPEANATTSFRNGPRIADYSRQLADRIGALVDEKRFPLVLGGDCSILLGSTLALRRRGRYGLCFIDGHNDFSYARDPKWRGSYSAAGLDLALATGHGPDALTSLDRLKPYVREGDVAALGVQYDAEDNSFFDVASFRNSRITTFEANAIRARGATKCAEKALAHVTRRELKGFWVHLDADVLHESIMPAVDSPNENGITFAQLTDLLRVLLASSHAIGMEVTIFDPELDPKGEYAAALVETLANGFNRT